MSTIVTTTSTTADVCAWAHGEERLLAFRFQANATGKIEDIMFRCRMYGSDDKDSRCAVFTDGAGVPGSLIGNWSGNVNVAIAAAADYHATIPSGGTDVTNGTYYWIVFDSSNGVYNNNFFSGSGNGASAEGFQVYSKFNGSTWQVDYPTTTIRCIITITEPATMPTVDTDAATDITHVTATLNGEITDVGSGDADERGFVYGTTSESDPGDVDPSASGYDDYATETGTFGAETFDAAVTGLAPSTTYYVRAYAHNGDGYAYGDEISFDTDAPPPFRFTNLPGVDFDEDDTCTIYAERLNDILERIEALEA